MNSMPDLMLTFTKGFIQRRGDNIEYGDEKLQTILTEHNIGSWKAWIAILSLTYFGVSVETFLYEQILACKYYSRDYVSQHFYKQHE